MSTAKKRPWSIIGMFALGVLPIALATLVYFSGWGIPEGRTNNGHLLNPPLDIKNLSLVNRVSEPVNMHTWWLFTLDNGACDQACQKSIYHIRQINVALGKNQERVQHGVITVKPMDLVEQTFLKDYPKLKQFTIEKKPLLQWLEKMTGEKSLNEHYIFIADPLGNVMLYYTPEQNPRDILDDLNKLLKFSTIG